MNVAIVFDVTENLPELRKRMKALGYYDRWLNTKPNNPSEIYNLPTSLLWKVDTDFAKALNELNSTITAMQAENTPIILLRCVTFSVNPWGGIIGVANTI